MVGPHFHTIFIKGPILCAWVLMVQACHQCWHHKSAARPFQCSQEAITSGPEPMPAQSLFPMSRSVNMSLAAGRCRGHPHYALSGQGRRMQLAVPMPQNPILHVWLSSLMWRPSYLCWQNSWCRHEEPHTLPCTLTRGKEMNVPSPQGISSTCLAPVVHSSSHLAPSSTWTTSDWAANYFWGSWLEKGWRPLVTWPEEKGKGTSFVEHKCLTPEAE